MRALRRGLGAHGNLAPPPVRARRAEAMLRLQAPRALCSPVPSPGRTGATGKHSLCVCRPCQGLGLRPRCEGQHLHHVTLDRGHA